MKKDEKKPEQIVDLTKIKGGLPKKTRSRSKPGTPTKLYWHAGTHAAIVEYQKETDVLKKNQIYIKDIMPAIEKLVENVININRFTASEPYEELKNDCVHFLFETIPKFDATRGTNSFSYMNICCKNFLIIRSKQKAIKQKKSISIDDPEALSNNDLRIIEEQQIVPSQETQLEQRAQAHDIIDMFYEMRNHVKTENELLCLNCIITIFKNIDSIDLLNKSAILFILRDMTKLSQKQLTTSLQALRRVFKKMKIENFL